MVKDNDILQAVRDQDTDSLSKLLQRSKNGKKLLHSAKKINVNFQDDDGMAAIHQAALQGNSDCITLLLNNGSTVNIVDNKGMTALHYAAWQGILEPVSLLLQAGASTNISSKDGDVPLHFCCQHGHVDVVQLLLRFHADPTIENNQSKTPLDLACEFGKCGVVELLIKSTLCNGILHDQRDLTVYKNRTTPLHLAAKGGHTDVIRLLVESNMDINRQTHQGTALHEASLYGKLEAVKLLIDAGIDVTAPNSYEQTALDIVHKFTRKAGAKELKKILQEASCAVNVRAVKSYSNSSDAQSLAFTAGELITVVDQKPNGVWRGFVVRDGRKSTLGYFPSNCVALLDHPMKSLDKEGASGLTSNDVLSHDSPRPWYSSTSLASSDLTSPTLRLPPTLVYPDCNNSNGGHYPPSSPSWRANEMAVIPENRISTCSRSSSTSTDSRVNYPQSQPQAINANVFITNYPQRLSSHSFGEPARHSYDSMSAISRQSYHSNSSSSMGSLDESGISSIINFAELYQQRMSESDIIFTWLSDLRYEAYHDNFIQAGYDMPTISRMTPEDLTAIGITKPGNRKKLTREISRLNIPDGIPDYIPNSIHQWLEELCLDEYLPMLEDQSYHTIEDIQEISWEDLEEIGIQKLGHQKKIMLAVERLKKLVKRQSQSGSVNSRDSTPISGSVPRWSADMAANGSFITSEQPFRCFSGENLSHSRENSPYSVPNSKSAEQFYTRSNSKYGAVGSGDVVPIQLKSGLSRSSSGNSVNSSEYAVPRCQSFTTQPDRDCTPPSSEDSGSSCGGSMQRSCNNKKGPIKGIHGLSMSKHSSQDSIDQHRNSMEGVSQYATLRRSTSRKQSSQSLDFNPHGYPSSPVNKCSAGATSPALGTLPSPFANFRSPYAQIQSGEVKNQLNKEKRSSSVPSSPVTKVPSVNNVDASGNRKPPAPPKRTLSMKRDPSFITSDGKKSDDEEEQFPPPLSPVAFSLEAMKANQPKTIRNDFSDRRLSPARDSLKLLSVTESTLAARRRAGSAEKEMNINNSNANVAEKNESIRTVRQPSSNHDTQSEHLYEKSNSNTPRNSIESIPFANDNAGTIRQKTTQPKATITASDFIEDDLDKALEMADDENSEADFNTVKRMPKPVMPVQPVCGENANTEAPSLNNENEKQEFLNDIGSMLESLTCELDAMLDT